MDVNLCCEVRLLVTKATRIRNHGSPPQTIVYVTFVALSLLKVSGSKQKGGLSVTGGENGNMSRTRVVQLE
jgi:hypothetical protein